MTGTQLARFVLLFLAAGICEVGGGQVVWLWLRDGRGIAPGALGGYVRSANGILPTLQPAGFAEGH